ncbi:MAG TPA: hypothetical protein VGT00_06965 [Methylomirabilota bacterium]|jgi:hypothetical protein|nr:hypothetical protein [Methylomirabilota bacterium]
MRKLVIVVGAIVAVLLVALIVLRVVGLDPKDRRAGLWLTGEVVATPVTDWSFTDKYGNIYVQTKTWYLVPHSVTTGCTAKDGTLYLTSVYRPGQQFPRDKAWNRNITRDPRVRLKIGDKLYDQKLALVMDETEKDAVLEAKAKKYPQQPAVEKSRVFVFKVLPG